MALPSKNSVRAAGKRIAEAGSVAKADTGDISLLDDWRKAHLLPLTAIAMWLRQPSLEATDLAPAQRLKRRDTLLDKLISGRSKDASTMHDLGGCRLIFQDVLALQNFRNYLEKESRAKHVLLHTTDKYDYVAHPKQTGYRGVHYVYAYRSSSDERAELEVVRFV